MQHKIMLRSAK